MRTFEISDSMLNRLSGMANLDVKVKKVIVDEWCKCTGMD